MQLGSRELMMFYIDLKQTNDVLLTFEALKVKKIFFFFLAVLGFELRALHLLGSCSSV
jgi:hypothetical protein